MKKEDKLAEREIESQKLHQIQKLMLMKMAAHEESKGSELNNNNFQKFSDNGQQHDQIDSKQLVDDINKYFDLYKEAKIKKNHEALEIVTPGGPTPGGPTIQELQDNYYPNVNFSNK